MSSRKWDIERLDSGGRSALKRNAGVMMGNNLKALEAFYRAVSYIPKNQNQESQWYACQCMECLWKTDEKPRVIRFEELLRRIYLSSETSESIRHRIVAILDVPWSQDGYLLGKLNNFARILRSKDGSVMPDFEALADDLAIWNHPDRIVQRRWIRTICGSQEEKQTENKESEGNENVD